MPTPQTPNPSAEPVRDPEAGVLNPEQRAELHAKGGRTAAETDRLGDLADGMLALAAEVRSMREERATGPAPTQTQARQAETTEQRLVRENEELRAQFDTLQRDIRQRNEIGGLTGSDPLIRSDDPDQKFSLVRAVQGAWLGWQGIAKSFPERDILHAVAEAKDLPHDTSAAGQLAILIPPQLMPDAIERLSARTVAFNAGAQHLGDLGGAPVEWPKIEGSQGPAEWLAESGETTDAELSMGALRLTPRELGSSAPLTKRMLTLTDDRARRIVEDDLFRRQGEGLDLGILKGGGGSGAPMGIMNVPGVGQTDFDADIGTGYDDGSGAGVQNATDYFDLMLAKIDARNADPTGAAFVCHPMVANRIRRVKDEDGHPILVSNTGMLPGAPDSANVRGTGRGTLWGQPVFTTTLLGAPADPTEFVVGDFSQVLVGGWGPLMLEISDANGTDFKKRRVLLLMTQLADCGIRHPEAFEQAVNWDLS